MLADLFRRSTDSTLTVRIRFDEIGELGALADRIESLLSKRFAFHAGTTFHLMVDNARQTAFANDAPEFVGLGLICISSS